MPIYEYKCKKCGYKFEKLVFKKEKVMCPKCKNTSLQKLVSNVNISKKSNSSKICRNGTCPIRKM